MARKIVANDNLKIYRTRHRAKTPYFCTPEEMRKVHELVGEIGYYLYSYYRTGFFNELEDLQDSLVGSIIGWVPSKVQKYRLALEKAELFLIVKYGTKQDGIAKVFVGEDTVALYKAGLPANIIDGPAFNKIKRNLKINTASEVVENIEVIKEEFSRNPDKY